VILPPGNRAPLEHFPLLVSAEQVEGLPRDPGVTGAIGVPLELQPSRPVPAVAVQVVPLSLETQTSHTSTQERALAQFHKNMATVEEVI
jgi:hypothetical protein